MYIINLYKIMKSNRINRLAHNTRIQQNKFKNQTRNKKVLNPKIGKKKA